MIKKMYDIEINSETIRQVTEEVGQIVFDADAERASAALENMDKIEMLDEGEKLDKTLDIMTDGAAAE